MADDSIPDDIQPPDLDAAGVGVAQAVANLWGVGGIMDWAVNNGIRYLVYKYSWVIKSAIRLARYAATILQAALEQGNDEFAALATTGLRMMFGQGLDITFPSGAAAGTSLQDNAAAVGDAVLTAVFGPLNLTGGAELTPGVDRAEAFLGAMTELVTRSWMVNLFTELPSFGQVKIFAELEEELISGLGLGRVARSVLRPIVQTIVAEPAQWAVNLAYRPKLHDVSDAIRLWELGELDDAALDDELGRQGWSAAKIEHAKALHLKPLDFDSGMVLARHGVVTEDDVVAGLQHDGFGDAAAAHRVAAWHLRRVDGWTDKYIALLVSQYTSGFITQSVFQSSLQKTGRPQDELQEIAILAGATIEVPRRILSKDELMAAWTNNVITQDQVASGLKLLGYADGDVTTILLTRLAAGQHAAEVAQQKADQIAARAAERAKEKAAAQAARAEAQQEHAAAQLAKAQAVAAEKAQAAQDAESRRELIAQQAAQRRQLVDAQQQAATIAKDHADALKAQIDASEKALIATANAQEAEANVTFERSLLALKQTNRENALETALADVDLAAEADSAARQQGVTLRSQTVDQILALQLADLDTLYTARDQNITDDLAAALAALDIAQLPTAQERQQAAAQKSVDLDNELTRKLADIAAEYADKHATVDDELAQGVITDKAAQRQHDTLTTAQAQAERLATQQHDLGIQRLTDAAGAANAVAAATAAADKTKLQAAADKQRQQLTADKLAAQIAAQHAADTQQLSLQAIQGQQAAISAAEVAKRKKALTDADAKQQAQEALQAATIDQAEQTATANAAKAQSAVAAAQQRLSVSESTASAREAAAADATAKLQAFDAQAETSREQLEQTIMSHRLGPKAAPPAKIQK